jgi:hypothetical protein
VLRALRGRERPVARIRPDQATCRETDTRALAKYPGWSVNSAPGSFARRAVVAIAEY